MLTRVLTNLTKREAWKSATSRRKDRSAPSPAGDMLKLENLESRVLMSTTVDAGVLIIEGTEAADNIVVQIDPQDETMVQVQVNDEVTAHAIDNLDRIRIKAGDGDDTVTVDLPDSLADISTRVAGGNGNDQITTSSGRDRVFGGDGDDLIDTGAGSDRVVGGDGDDVINGGGDRDKLFGGSGNDTVNGNDGDDRLGGGEGDDTIDGGEGADRIVDSQGENNIVEDESDIVVEIKNDNMPTRHRGFGFEKALRRFNRF